MKKEQNSEPEPWTGFPLDWDIWRFLYLWNYGVRRRTDGAAGSGPFAYKSDQRRPVCGLGVIQAGASFAEMALTQLVINLRYCLMSCSLSQKLSRNMPFFHRFFMAYGVTDEIFGVSVCREGNLSPWYSYGLMSAAVPGWTFGTFLGAVSGNLLPRGF